MRPERGPTERYGYSEASTQQATGGPSKAEKGAVQKISWGKNALLEMYPTPNDLPDAMLQQGEHKRGGRAFVDHLNEKL